MLVICGGLTALGAMAVVAFVVTGSEVPDWALVSLFGLLTPLFASAVLIRYNYWTEIADSIPVGPNQFPELWAIFTDLAARYQMAEVPPLYVLNGNGLLNAYASKCQVRKTYVVLYSDLVDIAYEHQDFEEIKFILAHELGHIHCGHVNLWRTSIQAVPSLLRITPSLSRAQEYSADRCAAFMAPAGAASAVVLFAGKNPYQRVNLDAYYAAVEQHKDGLWLRVVNFLAGHAVGFRRMQPLRDVPELGWDRHGRML